MADDAEIHAMLDQAARDLQVEIARVQENVGQLGKQVAVLLSQMHASPCAPMQERVMALEREQDQARGGLRTGLVLVALFSAVTGGVAALIAIFK